MRAVRSRLTFGSNHRSCCVEKCVAGPEVLWQATHSIASIRSMTSMMVDARNSGASNRDRLHPTTSQIFTAISPPQLRPGYWSRPRQLFAFRIREARRTQCLRSCTEGREPIIETRSKRAH